MCDMINFSIIYRDLRLVNAEDVLSRPEAMELAFFQNLMMRHIELAKDTLLKKYVYLNPSFAH